MGIRVGAHKRLGTIGPAGRHSVAGCGPTVMPARGVFRPIIQTRTPDLDRIDASVHVIFMTETPLSTRQRITDTLDRTFAPEALEVIDESELHHGHSGWREGGETHFRVKITAAAFAGKSRVDRHRMVNTALADELAGGVHALAIRAAAPGEG